MTTSLKLLRSSGTTDEILFSLNRTLKELKVAISQSVALGEVPVSRQRIFHLGRELKTSGRTLETLGVGRLGVTVLHVHAVPENVHSKPGAALVASSSKGPNVRQPQRRPKTQQAGATSTTTTTTDLSDDVIDLAKDSDDSDDDEDDCIVIDEVATRNSKKRRIA